ncbi:hypothetical protein [Legionella clemsonensis]|uniref:Uncharacterized protein n=1 Tax=Legionella clemsonensis TaxID=1867846 RepID=A0A222P256_9GAMM|nr:hypothetical protein [Legionella clemsonensis]ASQ45934.1 hypothetical protein clem_06895 [Legionella clemsonensis]
MKNEKLELANYKIKNQKKWPYVKTPREKDILDDYAKIAILQRNYNTKTPQAISGRRNDIVLFVKNNPNNLLQPLISSF